MHCKDISDTSCQHLNIHDRLRATFSRWAPWLLLPCPRLIIQHSDTAGAACWHGFSHFFCPLQLTSRLPSQINSRRLYLGLGHCVVLKAFLFSQQPKLEGGKWERKHFKLTFLQEMSPVRWERLPGTGKGLEGFAEWHIHTFGDLTTRPDFLPSLGCSQSKQKWSYVESSLAKEFFFTAAYENWRKDLWRETN